LRIRGEAEEAPPWDKKIEPVQNWFYPTRETTYGDVHHLSSIARAPNGDLLMKLSTGDKFHGGTYTPVLIRSSDNGRSWSAQQKLPDRLAPAVLFDTREGQLMMLLMQTEKPFAISMTTSSDNGETWSEYEECGSLAFPEDVDQVIPNELFQLKDGTLLWTTYRRSAKPLDPYYYKQVYPHGSFCIRSSDGGKSWSAPVNMDGPKPKGFEKYMMIPKHFGSETSAAQTRDGRIVAFVRSYWEPVMWETWSADGGKTWTPASRGPFGMWAATNSMLSTESGALLIAGRHPGLAFHLSYDDGMTWQCFRFDTTFWANGCTYEVEPDLVLYASTAKYSDSHVRVHLIRITPDGPEPVRVP
jgi:hypothetical protein